MSAPVRVYRQATVMAYGWFDQLDGVEAFGAYPSTQSLAVDTVGREENVEQRVPKLFEPL
jgi:hypothetical protein